MTELQEKGLEAVARLKCLAFGLYGEDLGVMYMKWAQVQARKAWKLNGSQFAFDFVCAQVERLEKQEVVK